MPGKYFAGDLNIKIFHGRILLFCAQNDRNFCVIEEFSFDKINYSSNELNLSLYFIQESH